MPSPTRGDGVQWARTWAHVWVPVLAAAVSVLVPWLPGVDLLAMRLRPAEVAAVVWAPIAIPALILALAYLSISLDTSGFFRWCALRILRAGRGRSDRLLVVLFVAVSVLTFVTSNDIVILAMTPILFHLARAAGLTNLTPLLLVQFFAANTASAALFIGNPTNIVVGAAADVGFGAFFVRMALPTLVACAMQLVLLLWWFRSAGPRGVPNVYLLPSDAADEVPWTREMTVKLGLFGLCLVAMATTDGDDGAVANALLGIATGAAVLALALDVVQDLRVRNEAAKNWTRRRLARLPVEVVPFFASFCVLVELLSRAGVVDRLGGGLVVAFQHGLMPGALATGGGGLLLVNTVNNIPASLVVQQLLADPMFVTELGGPASPATRVFVDCAVLVLNLGANFTVVGALAGLMWLRIIRDLQRQSQTPVVVPTALGFLRVGLVVTPLVVIFACLTVAWLAG